MAAKCRDMNLHCHNQETCDLKGRLFIVWQKIRDSVDNFVWEVVSLMWYCSIHSKWTQTAVELWRAWHCQVWVYGSPCRTLQLSGSSMRCHTSHCVRWMWHLQFPKCWPVSTHYNWVEVISWNTKLFFQQHAGLIWIGAVLLNVVCAFVLPLVYAATCQNVAKSSCSEVGCKFLISRWLAAMCWAECDSSLHMYRKCIKGSMMEDLLMCWTFDLFQIFLKWILAWIV